MRMAVVLSILCLLGACHKSGPAELLPASAGPWNRVSLENLPVNEAPEIVARSSLKRIQIGNYDGPGKVEARVFELTSPAVSLDLAQRWTPAPDTVFFYRENYFAVVTWHGAERKALQQLLRILENEIGKV